MDPVKIKSCKLRFTSGASWSFQFWKIHDEKFFFNVFLKERKSFPINKRRKKNGGVQAKVSHCFFGIKNFGRNPVVVSYFKIFILVIGHMTMNSWGWKIRYCIFYGTTLVVLKFLRLKILLNPKICAHSPLPKIFTKVFLMKVEKKQGRGIFSTPIIPVSYTHLTLPTNREV